MKYCRINAGSWAVIDGQQVKLLENAPYEGIRYTGQVINLSEVKLICPVEPTKIVCIGKNYYDHAIELGGEVPKTPIIFIKPNTVLSNPDDGVPYPSISKRLDYEGELCVVIGKKAAKVSADEANDYIFGYTCFNDITARDIQYADGQWTRGKSCDLCGPVGPIVTDEIDPGNLKIETKLNGEVVQSSNTNLLMWSVPKLIEFVSASMTLLPGDIIPTGTPAGVGPMSVGDKVEVCIEGIGTLTNYITE